MQSHSKAAVQAFISSAFQEDVGDGDHSTLGAVPASARNTARLLVKGEGVLAGVELAEMIFHYIDPDLTVAVYLNDGDRVKPGDVGFRVDGSARSILTAERLVLNCMQRMSGIATYTRRLTDMISHTNAQLIDTRKTTPNFRLCEKWAVRIGGGKNHRFGLFDMVMLKDNHIDFAGGITQAVKSSSNYLNNIGKPLNIEVETRSLEEVKEAMSLEGVSSIMLDNMSPATMKEALQLINGRCATEASGGITEETIVAVAETGVNYISVGALTHSFSSIDMSLKAKI